MERLVVEAGGVLVLPEQILKSMGLEGAGMVRLTARGKELVIEKSHLQIGQSKRDD